MITCPSCDRVSDPTPKPGTPCPGCGEPLGDEPPLEVDSEWAAKKAATQAAAAEPPRKKVSTFARASLGVALIVVIAVIAVMVAQRSPLARGTKAGEGVRITITAPRPTKISVDGAPAGTTPVTLVFRNASQPLRIEGGGRTAIVTPDRDRVVDLE